MRNKLSGFKQGTTHVTTGDKMKEGDHRRSKFSCRFYNNSQCNYYKRKCTGSAHCDNYDDGIKIDEIKHISGSNEVSKEDLNNYVNNLRNRIPFDSLEGKGVQWLIINKHQLKTSEVQLLEKQEADFYSKKTELESETNMYNNSLKTKCIIAGLLIITAPFCYYYYQNNKRTISSTMISDLEKRTINKDLQDKVKEYKNELNKYKKDTQNLRIISKNIDVNDNLYNTAKLAYEKTEFGNFVFYIKKSIDSYNTKAVVYLSNIYQNEELCENNKQLSFLLLLYSSYLGCKTSSESLAKAFLNDNPNSKIGKAFLEKSKN